MTTLRASVPPSVPQQPGANSSFVGDVTAATVTDSTALDTKPDARTNPPGATTTAADPQSPQQSASDQQNAKKKKKKEKKAKPDPTQAAPVSTPSSAAPASPSSN